MKKVLLYTLLIIMICLVFVISSCGRNTGDNTDNNFKEVLYYTLLDDGTYSVKIGNAGDREISIPAEYEGKAVTKIEDRAQYGTNSMGCLINYGAVSVEIPDSIKSIGSLAFYGCNSLEEIRVSDGNAQFKSKNGILYSKDETTLISYAPGKKDTKFSIPEGVTDIGKCAFIGCEKLTDVTVPESVTSIGDSAFRFCDGLKVIALSKKLNHIGAQAFDSCSGIESIIIPKSVISIGNYAFRFCERITVYCEATSKPNGWSEYIMDSFQLGSSDYPVYWYSESEPEHGVVGGINPSYWINNNRWHYVNGEITIWE